MKMPRVWLCQAGFFFYDEQNSSCCSWQSRPNGNNHWELIVLLHNMKHFCNGIRLEVHCLSYLCEFISQQVGGSHSFSLSGFTEEIQS